MKDLHITVLAVLMTAAAATPLLAGPRLCSNGHQAMLSGDLFSPVECSTTTKAAVLLPGLPVLHEGKTVKTNLKDLSGRWEGTLIHALGRYDLLLTIKTSWGGKTTLTLDLKELQFRERLTDRLTLNPGKERGTYEAELSTTLAPETSLSGNARIGAAVPPKGSALSDRQADVSFSNGAKHRIIFALKGNTDLRVRAFTAIPGAPLQTFETDLRRTQREAL